ncbi:MAG TPA: hypothetical protein VGH36_10055 [Acetobacteraceae bacterium]
MSAADALRVRTSGLRLAAFAAAGLGGPAAAHVWAGLDMDLSRHCCAGCTISAA